MTRAEIFQCDLERLIADRLACPVAMIGTEYTDFAAAVVEVFEAADTDDETERRFGRRGGAIAALGKALARFHGAVARMAGA